MRVSARADYALRAAIELAAASGSHVTGEQLARAQNIPGKFTETILTQLRRSGLVRSQRGADGGFWLARPASEISLADIIRAVDGQFPSARGEPPENVTYPGAAEPLRRVWIALRAFGPTVLETVTLADIVSGELWLPGRTPPSSGDSRPGLASCGPGPGPGPGRALSRWVLAQSYPRARAKAAVIDESFGEAGDSRAGRTLKSANVPVWPR